MTTGVRISELWEVRAEREIHDDPGESIMPLPIAVGLRRCPHCTWDYPMPDSKFEGYPRTFGCVSCRGTGHGTRWVAVARKHGGHYQVEIRYGNPGSSGLAGSVTMDEKSWEMFKFMIGHPHVGKFWEIREYVDEAQG